MDRKTYITETYSKYWLTAREKIYGFMDYDRSLLKFIVDQCNQQNSKILEVAVGTGYPFADYLCNAGYEVHGIDLSPDLIHTCRKNNPKIHCKVGDAEQLDYPDNFFDFVYCVHSSWYIPDLNNAIGEMFRAVRPGGRVLFDVQNIHNEYISKIYKAHVFYNTNWAGMIMKTIKNLAKFITRHGVQDWPFVVSEVPSDPKIIINFLRELNTKKIQVMARMNDGSIANIEGEVSPFEKFDRLIFHIIK